jgi:hypothetical protein
MKKAADGKFLLINIELLRCFQEPTSAFEIFQCGSWCTYSSVHRQVSKLLDLGLITLACTGYTLRHSGVKKFWVLTKKGQLLLELFPEKESDDSLLEAVK